MNEEADALYDEIRAVLEKYLPILGPKDCVDLALAATDEFAEFYMEEEDADL